MATYTKLPLSGSTNGKPIAVSATGTPGTLIHTAQSGTSGIDEIWLYVVNSTTSNVKLTLEFGGTTTAENIEVTVVAESGLLLVTPGLILNNSQVVRAFAGTTNVLNIVGYVNRIS